MMMEAQTTVAASGDAAAQQSTPQTIAQAASAPAAAPAPRVNLDEDPNFRAYKSTMERKLAEQARQQAAERQALEAQLNEQQRLLERNLAPDEVAALQVSRMQRELQGERARREAIEMEQARQQALADLAARYEVPLDELAHASNPADAYERVLELNRRKAQTLEQRLAAIEADIAAKQAAASTVVVASPGVPANGAASLQAKYDDALRARNSKAMDAVLSEAAKAGVTIDRLRAFNSKA